MCRPIQCLAVSGLADPFVPVAAGTPKRHWDVERFVIVADPTGPAINLYRSLSFDDTEPHVQLVRPPDPLVIS